MTRAEVEAALQQLELASNVTVEAGQLLVSASNTVLVHTPLFRHPTYSQLVRLLFNFMASQASVVCQSNNHAHNSKQICEYDYSASQSSRLRAKNLFRQLNSAFNLCM